MGPDGAGEARFIAGARTGAPAATRSLGTAAGVLGQFTFLVAPRCLVGPSGPAGSGGAMLRRLGRLGPAQGQSGVCERVVGSRRVPIPGSDPLADGGQRYGSGPSLEETFTHDQARRNAQGPVSGHLSVALERCRDLAAAGTFVGARRAGACRPTAATRAARASSATRDSAASRVRGHRGRRPGSAERCYDRFLRGGRFHGPIGC